MSFWQILLVHKEVSEYTVAIASHSTYNYLHESNIRGKDLGLDPERVLYSGILIVTLYVGKMRIRSPDISAEPHFSCTMDQQEHDSSFQYIKNCYQEHCNRFLLLNLMLSKN